LVDELLLPVLQKLHACLNKKTPHSAGLREKMKKAAKVVGKLILTAIAVCIWWPLGVTVGLALFCGMEVFNDGRP
jgi:hypothetical protein